ncbi:MAG: UDP-2,3-diacylglucosamine diphosphatase [Herminiimonas sp.]|nr:UDP-2,3-diacylglucosamine diphosphatase [Herminiimonas sp.]
MAATAALFVSDVHLQPGAPRTTRAFLDFLERHGRTARQIYLLGDLFEYWAGDDDLASAFNAEVVALLRSLSDLGVELFWMAGNRDFLVGDAFAAATGARLLPDPSVLTIGGRRLVLTHGDAQCTDDIDYQRFRRMVRDPAWQQAFLARPLAERLATIAQMRAGSRAAQRNKTSEIMDVNDDAIAALFSQSGTALMIHGHTHRPALHRDFHNGVGTERHVLPDWDAETMPMRGGGIAIDESGQISLLTLTAPEPT